MEGDPRSLSRFKGIVAPKECVAEKIHRYIEYSANLAPATNPEFYRTSEKRDDF
jgi:hypothetical protein